MHLPLFLNLQLSLHYHKFQMVEKKHMKAYFLPILIKKTINLMHHLILFFILLSHLIYILKLDNLIMNHYKIIYLLYYLSKHFIQLMFFHKCRFFDYSFLMFGTYSLFK